MKRWLEGTFPGGKWQASGDYLVSSPLREDRHPSFAIHPEKRVWHDFATGEHGLLSELCKTLGIEEPGREGRAKALLIPPVDPEARQLWEKGVPATAHGYAERKGFPLDGLKVNPANGELLIPQRDPRDGSLIGVERIAAREPRSKDDKTKFQVGKRGGIFQIGSTDGDQPILISEGVSTGYALHRATQWPVFVAFSAPMLAAMYQTVRYLHPGREIAVAPDYDKAGHDNAEKAAALGATVVQLPEGSQDKDDWLDLEQRHGIEIVKGTFRDQWQARRKVEKIVEPPKRSILDVVKSPSPGTAVKPEKVWHFPRKHLNLVAADSGMGKSLLITKVCCDLSIGAPVLETTSEPIRRVLYLNGECGRDYFDWRFLSSGWKYSEEHFKVLHQEDLAEDGIDLDLDTPQGRKNLEILLDGIGPDLLVIDSLPAFSNEDLNDGTVQNEIGKYLKALAIKYNLALVLITHLRKRRLQDQNTEPTLSEIQGSNAAAKLCNVALAVFERVVEIGGEERTVKVCKSVKSWGRQVAPFGFCFPELDEDSLSIEMVDLPRSKQLAGSWERVKDALKNTEFTRQSVESILGISDRTAKGLLSDWKQQGKIESIGRGPKTVYLVRNGQSAPTVHISSPIPTNPVIASIESVKPFFTDTSPQAEDESVKNTFTDSNPVISMNDDVSVKYIDGASPIASPIENRVLESVKSPSPCGNLERFNLPMNRTKEKARQEFFALLDEGVEVDMVTGKPMSEIVYTNLNGSQAPGITSAVEIVEESDANSAKPKSPEITREIPSLPCGPSQQWLESQPSHVREFYEAEIVRITRIGVGDEVQRALRSTYTKFSEVSA